MATTFPWEQKYTVTPEPTGASAQGLRVPTQQPQPLATSGSGPWNQPWQVKGLLDKEPESQAIRMAAQGALFGFADELEAALRSTFGPGKYDDVVKQIRGEIQAYQKANPGKALAAEMAGAMALPGPGLLRLLAGKSPTVTRMLVSATGAGAISGGLTAAGMQEGDALERLSASIPGAGFGAVASPVVAGAGAGGKILIDKFMDFARRRVGKRGASAIEAELQRLARDMDMTPEEIAAKVASGEIMAENATIRDTIRAYTRGKGGEAGKVLREALTRRPGELREEAVLELNKYLAPGMTGNVRKAVTATDDELKRLEQAMYDAAYREGAVFTKPLLDAMTAAIKRTRGNAANVLEETYTAQTGRTPFFTINKSGEVVFDRAPTLQDAEVLRRGLRDLQSKAFSKGLGSAGEGYKEAELALRGEIDVASSAVASARAQAAQRRSARDMFNQGKSVFAQNADQIDIDFGKLMQSGDVNAVRYYRMGVMDAIRGRMAGGNRTTMLRKLTDPDTKEGQILRHVFPGDELDRVIGSLGRATQSAQAAGAVLGGSGTAPQQAAAARIGSDISDAEIISAASGNVFALPGIALKLVKKIAPGDLTDAQRKRVADVLVSQDPNLVLNALKDSSSMARLQAFVARLTSVAPALGTGAGGGLGGIVGANIMNEGQ